MSLAADDVVKIAQLARLAVADSDIPGYVQDLSAILDLVASLEQAPTEGIMPLAHPLEMSQRLRSDQVTEENLREHFQAVAPAVESGLYLVPKVIE
jgi:aspartyl-tRNA(Asn)/glutamyl-tRNA(Gln) amidotransferase subunit C